ncbi:hypothetical protein GCM10010416_28620 [Streptomyces caniferus]
MTYRLSVSTVRNAPGEHSNSGKREPNRALAEALRQAGWSPRELMRVLNPRLTAVGEPALHLTASQGWLAGGRPRSQTVRRLTVTALSEAAGIPYTVAGLWGDQRNGKEAERGATDDLLGRRSLDDVLASAAAWTAADPRDQASAKPASEEQLFGAVWDATHQAASQPRLGPGTDQVLPPMMDVLEGHLRGLRRLDDTAGGGALPQRYVRTELLGVLDLLRNSRYTPEIRLRLLTTASGLSQLAGWMAFDADLSAPAQRYQLFAIRLARAANDSNGAANVLGMLAYQHAATGKPSSALRFAEAAVEHTAGSAPTVRARALGRLATAHAAAGDMRAFRSVTDQCRVLLDHRRDDDPPSLYYFTAEQVAAESGHALVELAAANPAQARRLLAEATDLLTPLTDHGANSGYPRSALLHGIHLARAHLLRRDSETTVGTLLHLAGRVPDVQSIRCRNLLSRIRRQVGSRVQSGACADALVAVDRALSAT